MSDLDVARELRPLGRLERFHVARHAIGFYTNVAVTGQYRVASSALEKAGGIEPFIYPILQKIILRHPSMRIAVLNEETKEPSWKRLARIDLKDVVRIIEVHVMDQFLEAGHSKAFERTSELPLWRVFAGLLSSNGQVDSENVTLVVGFFFHHAIGDGGSGVAFHLDFSELLNEGDQSGSQPSKNSIVEISSTTLLPSLEELKSLTLSYWKIGTEVFKLFFPPDKSSLWTGLDFFAPSDDGLETRISTLYIPSWAAAKVALICRKNSATFTPLISVMIANILTEMYPHYTDVYCGIPISMRRFTGIGKRAMVDHFSNVNIPYTTVLKANHIQITAGGPVDWEVVRACKKQIDTCASSPADQAIALLRLINDYESFFKNQIGKQRGHSFEVSNVGLVDLDDDKEDSKSKCLSLTASQSANVTGGPYSFTIAAVKGGDTAITLTWQDGVVPEEEAKLLMCKLETALLHLADEEDT